MADPFSYRPLGVAPGSFDPMAMSTGEPGPPRRVEWDGRSLAVVHAARGRKTTGRDRGGSDERYITRHWYTLHLEDGTELEAYFDRRARVRAPRWWARMRSAGEPA